MPALIAVAAAATALTTSLGTAAASAAPPPPTPPTSLAGIGPGLLPPPSSISASAADLCAQTAYKVGFSYIYYVNTPIGATRSIVVATAVAMAESGCNPSAVYTNPNGCRDRGLWQIDDCYWPQVSDGCAFNAQCNGNAAWGLISNQGTDWRLWSTYNSGAWENYVPAAREALSRLTVTLSSQGAGTCLDAKSQTPHNGGVIQQRACNSSDPYQQWHLVQGGGTENPVLQNVGDGFCLDAQSQTADNGGVIQQWACHTTTDPYQRWNVQGSGLDTTGHADLLLHNDKAGTCLDAKSQTPHNGGVIQQWVCSSTDPYQQWN
ncbi:MAG: ricin-type beta-trefoil lectin domain protein [Streptosporangiaceae bacterium]|nr:ricin-type beta-trefoil lectin domain protein [Streptosporangiaceae bacterium]MBV9853821.1 ricin-type beta-trefoil lectin domain protein [Streptosporangiaceae bacterium]